MKIVLDTNVLVSGMIRPSGPPGRIVDLVRAGAVELVVDDRILDEYVDVLRRESLAAYFPPSPREDIIEFLRQDTQHVTCTELVTELPDDGDIPFLEAALAASVPLVTGNTKHFPRRRRRGAEVLTPREFIERFPSGA